MTRAIILVFGLCLALGSCTQRMICPAYQSAFIHDQDELRKKFSYFKADTTPKIYTASKNKYLIAEEVSYHHKLRSMQTVRMKQVPVHVPDSISNPESDSVVMADMRRATQSIMDTTFIPDLPRADSVKAPAEDSVYVITKDREHRLLKYDAPDSLLYDSATQRYVSEAPKYYVKDVRFNMEQDNYMWYLRDVLLLPDVKLAREQQEGGDKDEAAPNGRKKGKGAKGLFRKKQNEQPADTTELEQPPGDEFDYVDQPDTTSQAEIPQPKPKKDKKGLFGKKKKETNPKTPPKSDPAKKDEDDGF
jgi:hypothetical protein